MRFKVKLTRAIDTDTPISLDYRRRFISLLKRIFNPDFDEESVKPYTFAVYMGKFAKIEKDFITNVQAINFRFSTGHPSVSTQFYNGLLRLKKSNYLHNMNPKMDGALFRITQIELEKEYEPKGAFKTLSPVVVERTVFQEKNPDKRYATPKDDDFVDVLLENLKRRCKIVENEELLVNKFFFEPINIKEEFVKHYGGYLKTFLGSFKIITDNKKVLEFIYHYGIGIRTGQGFGYLEVLT